MTYEHQLEVHRLMGVRSGDSMTYNSVSPCFQLLHVLVKSHRLTLAVTPDAVVSGYIYAVPWSSSVEKPSHGSTLLRHSRLMQLSMVVLRPV